MEDDNGEIIRELIKDGDAIILYKSMREARRGYGLRAIGWGLHTHANTRAHANARLHARAQQGTQRMRARTRTHATHARTHAHSA